MTRRRRRAEESGLLPFSSPGSFCVWKIGFAGALGWVGLGLDGGGSLRRFGWLGVENG